MAVCCSHFATETLIARSNFDFPGDDDYYINNDDYHINHGDWNGVYDDDYDAYRDHYSDSLTFADYTRYL